MLKILKKGTSKRQKYSAPPTLDSCWWLLFGSYQNNAASRSNPFRPERTSTELLVFSAWLSPCTAGGRKPCLIPSVLLQISVFPHLGVLKITATVCVSVDNEWLLYPHGVFLFGPAIYFMVQAAILSWILGIQYRMCYNLCETCEVFHFWLFSVSIV